MSKKLDAKINAMKKASAHLKEMPKDPDQEDVNILEQVKRDPKERLKEKIGLLKEMAAFLKAMSKGDIAKDDAPPPPPPTLGDTATSGGTNTINSAIGSPFGKAGIVTTVHGGAGAKAPKIAMPKMTPTKDLMPKPKKV